LNGTDIFWKKFSKIWVNLAKLISSTENKKQKTLFHSPQENNLQKFKPDFIVKWKAGMGTSQLQGSLLCQKGAKTHVNSTSSMLTPQLHVIVHLRTCVPVALVCVSKKKKNLDQLCPKPPIILNHKHHRNT